MHAYGVLSLGFFTTRWRLRPTWSPGFAAAVKVLRTVAYSVPRDVQAIRMITDHAIPTWLPTLPAGVRCFPSDEPPGEWYFSDSLGAKNVLKHKGLYVLYFHGGAFCVCNSETHRGILFRVVDAADACIFAVNYRRPPEFPYPTPLDDCLEAYRYLLQNVDPSRIVFMGDSAGGGLAVSTMLAARAVGLPLPAAAVLLSPWVDLGDNSSPSFERNAAYDYIPEYLMDLFAESYRGDARWEDVSPIYSSALRGLPPMLIECGECELLVDQIIKFAAKCVSEDVPIELNVRDDMVHVFQLFAFTAMPQCAQSFAAIARFCASHAPPDDEQMHER